VHELRVRLVFVPKLAWPKYWQAHSPRRLFGWLPIFWLTHSGRCAVVYILAKSRAFRGRAIPPPKKLSCQRIGWVRWGMNQTYPWWHWDPDDILSIAMVVFYVHLIWVSTFMGW
jgi:hypothetical protein